MDQALRWRFRRASWLNVLGNLAKILVEGAIGVATGSVALLADAAHSVADLIASAVVLMWGGAGFDDPDEEHPHGHARFEPITAVVVGSAIVLMGIGLLYESTKGIYHGSALEFSYLLIAGLLFAIANMAVVYWYTVRVNDAIGSTALGALAVDCRNDIYTSTAALVGILGVWAGYPVFDPVAGGLVSVLVIGQGIQIGRENVDYIVGSAAPAEMQERVRGTLLSHSDVRGVHDLVVYYEGTELEVESHVEVDGGMSLREAHELESALIRKLRMIDGIRDAHVHLDPSGVGEWKDADEAGGRQ